MRPYLVRQGDHLASIAARNGFDAEAVWNDDANAELRTLRRSPQVLAPGDLLYVPEPERPTAAALHPNTTNRYTATQPRVQLRLTLGAGDEVLAGEPYRVEGLAHPIEGTTDGEGRLSEELPATTRSVRVVLPSRDGYALDVRLGNLNPADRASGQSQRLANLGLMPSLRGLDPAPPQHDREQERARRRDAVRFYQRATGHDETGELDDETSSSLDRRHGGP